MLASFGLSEHISELRKRLKVIFVSLAVAVLVVLLLPIHPSELLSFTSVYYTTPLSLFLNAVKAGTLPAGWQLIPVTVGAPLEVLLYGALILGLAIDMPVIAYEVFRFVDPALKPEERGMVYPVIASATTLFAVGLLFGYFVLAKFIFIAMAPFYTATGVTTPYLISVSDFYSIVFLSVLFSGGAFVSPVFVFLLIRFGVVSPRFFSKNRVLIWAVTYVATAVVTPDGGPVLDVMLFVPIVALLELAVVVGRRYAPPGREDDRLKCRHCGEVIEPRRLFCPSCGKSVG